MEHKYILPKIKNTFYYLQLVLSFQTCFLIDFLLGSKQVLFEMIRCYFSIALVLFRKGLHSF